MGLFLVFKASYSSVVLINVSCFGGQRAYWGKTGDEIVLFW